MLETQQELDDALSRPVTNDPTDLTELEDELEDLLKQPAPTPIPQPKPEEKIRTPVQPAEPDPFAELEERLQRLGVRERESIVLTIAHFFIASNFLSLADAKKLEIASSDH